MVLVPPGAVGLKFWRPLASDKRTANAWNIEDKSATITLSNGDKTATAFNIGVLGVRSTTQRQNNAVGKYYAEYFINAYTGSTTRTGISRGSGSLPGVDFDYELSNGFILIGGSGTTNIGICSNSDVVCVAWNSDAKLIWFRRNNDPWNNNVSADPATDTGGLTAPGTDGVDYALKVNTSAIGDSITLRTEVADFTLTVPSGFTSWMGETLLLPEEVTGTGALAADAAALSGSGTVEAIGTGAVAVNASVVSGTGVSASVATGALLAQAAATAGAGISASTGAGALTAQNAAASGSGLAASTGTGTLAAASSTASGAGASNSTGIGALVAGSAEVAGTGSAAAANTGALVAQAAVVAGLGVSVSTGAGAVQADAATIAGIGLSASAGNGALVAGAATVAGEGVVLDAGAIVGVGALTAGAATIAGAGEVTGEVVPPVFVGGGYWRQRPFAVEGVGYGILPQLEGEAYGAVVVAGAGVAILPGLRGAAVGSVGVVGRSAARLAVKAAADGDLGQAGAAVAVLKGAAASGSGVAGARGSGSGVVLGLKGTAIGRHDDDEAAIVTLLLAA